MSLDVIVYFLEGGFFLSIGWYGAKMIIKMLEKAFNVEK